MVIVKFNEIGWERKGILYRGGFQHHVEMRILSSLIERRKPSYYGCATPDGLLTFTTPSLHEAFLHAEHTMEGETGLNGIPNGVLELLMPPVYDPAETPLTVYPVVIAINAEKYRSRIHRPPKKGTGLIRGEGMAILGDISAEDIVPVFGLGIDNTPGFYPPHRKEMIDTYKKALTGKMKGFRLSERSFLERLENGETDIRGLITLLFGQRMMSRSEVKESREKTREAVGYLEQFFRKAGFE